MRVMIVDAINEKLEPRRARIPDRAGRPLDGGRERTPLPLDPDRRSMILTTQTSAYRTDRCWTTLSVFTAQHPDFDFGTLGQLTDLTNSLFLDGAIH